MHKIKETKAEELKRNLRALPDIIGEKEPRLLGFHVFLNEDETRAAVVQIHPDADSFEFQMKVAGEHISASYQNLDETASTWIFGTPSQNVFDMVDHTTHRGGTNGHVACPIPIRRVIHQLEGRLTSRRRSKGSGPGRLRALHEPLPTKPRGHSYYHG